MSRIPDNLSWDVSLDEVPFCVVDFETTQLPYNSKALAIIDIGAQQFLGENVVADPFTAILNPGCPISPFDRRVSGITDNAVSSAPTFLDIKSDLFRYIEGQVIVAHNARFDKRALESQCSLSGCSHPTNLYVDTMRLLKKAVPLKSYSLEKACEYLGIPRPTAHRALPDCQAAMQLFLGLLERLKQSFSIRTLEELCRIGGTEGLPQQVQRSLFD